MGGPRAWTLDAARAYLRPLCDAVTADILAEPAVKKPADELCRLPIYVHQAGSARLPEWDVPVCVGQAAPHGRGVFTTRAVRAGELLTLYACDAVSMDAGYGDGRMLTWEVGKGVMAADLVAAMSYAAPMRGPPSAPTSQWMVHGDPARPVRAWACGHMANDAHPDVLRMNLRPATSAELHHGHLAYMLRTKDRANAAHVTLVPGCALGTVATRDIAAGQEVLVCYGYEYWLELEPGRSHALLVGQPPDARLALLLHRTMADHSGFIPCIPGRSASSAAALSHRPV